LTRGEGATCTFSRTGGSNLELIKQNVFPNLRRRFYTKAELDITFI